MDDKIKLKKGIQLAKESIQELNTSELPEVEGGWSCIAGSCNGVKDMEDISN